MESLGYQSHNNCRQLEQTIVVDYVNHGTDHKATGITKVVHDDEKENYHNKPVTQCDEPKDDGKVFTKVLSNNSVGDTIAANTKNSSTNRYD